MRPDLSGAHARGYDGGKDDVGGGPPARRERRGQSIVTFSVYGRYRSQFLACLTST